VEWELVTKLVPNAVSAVAALVMAGMFIKVIIKVADKFVEQIQAMSRDCHTQTSKDQKAFQDQIENLVNQQAKLAEGYESAMKTFAAAIGTNGEILKRMEGHLQRRGIGRRHQDWEEAESKGGEQ
jgi:cyclophilin family peptidyl-prolyl cis-trans isomerase